MKWVQWFVGWGRKRSYEDKKIGRAGDFNPPYFFPRRNTEFRDGWFTRFMEFEQLTLVNQSKKLVHHKFGQF